MPKMKFVTDEMINRAGTIGQNSDRLFQSQNNVTKIFKNMEKVFSGKIPGLMNQHIIAMDSDYKAMNSILTNYKTFLEDNARTYEWTDEQLARWAEALGKS